MNTREDLLRYLWDEIINSSLRDGAIDSIVDGYMADEDQPFGDTGPALKRILESGASRSDVALVMRETAYTAVFATLYAIGDPGVEDDDVFMLHEQLLIADPSDMDGRPGSAELVRKAEK